MEYSFPDPAAVEAAKAWWTTVRSKPLGERNPPDGWSVRAVRDMPANLASLPLGSLVRVVRGVAFFACGEEAMLLSRK